MKKIISVISAFLLCTCTLSAYKASASEEDIWKLVSHTSDFSDGGFIYSTECKYDVKNNMLIVYGFGETNIYNGIFSYNPDYHYAADVPFGNKVFYGMEYSVGAGGSVVDVVFFPTADENGNVIVDGIFAEPSTVDLIKDSKAYGFDIAPYALAEIKAGDADCNGKIDASDASIMLEAYSLISTGVNIELNSTIFDFDGNGIIDSNDSAVILDHYSLISTGE